MKIMKNIEIEFRARFGVAKYKELKKFLNRNAKNLGEDDKDVYFFLFPNKLLKVVDNISQKSARLVLKLNKIGNGSDFEEIEIPIDQKYFERMAKVLIALETGDYVHSFQRRRNYLYKGVELALKWSKDWGYHLELEVMVKKLSKKKDAEKKIFAVAENLDVEIMTDSELKKFTQKAEKKYKRQAKIPKAI